MHPLVDQLITKYNYTNVNTDNFDEFTSSHEYSVLFFQNNPTAFPETLDVAVILPELIKHFNDKIVPAIMDRRDEKIFQKQYGFFMWPTLVFLKNGEYLAAISKVRNWDDYIIEIERIVTLAPSEPPIKK